MLSSLTCPVCNGALVEPQSVPICGACHHNLASSGTIAVHTTAEFAAVTPSQAAAILNDPSATAAVAELITSCTWCGKAQAEVKKLLSGGGAHICDECVALCADILDAEIEGWRG
jgi:ClpX C4-type zinc finger protein